MWLQASSKLAGGQLSFILNVGCFSENVPRCQVHLEDELSLISWRDTDLRWQLVLLDC